MRRVALIGLSVVCLGIWGWGCRTPQVPAAVPPDRSDIGHLNLRQRHPDGASGPEEFAEHTVPDALQRLDQIRRYLAAFNRLIELSRGKVTEAEMTEVSNISNGLEDVGFHNVPLRVEGTLLKQDYQLRQVEYELAQLKRVRGEVTAAEVESARVAYASSTARFQEFWDTKGPTD